MIEETSCGHQDVANKTDNEFAYATAIIARIRIRSYSHLQVRLIVPRPIYWFAWMRFWAEGHVSFVRLFTWSDLEAAANHFVWKAFIFSSLPISRPMPPCLLLWLIINRYLTTNLFKRKSFGFSGVSKVSAVVISCDLWTKRGRHTSKKLQKDDASLPPSRALQALLIIIILKINKESYRSGFVRPLNTDHPYSRLALSGAQKLARRPAWSITGSVHIAPYAFHGFLLFLRGFQFISRKDLKSQSANT